MKKPKNVIVICLCMILTLLSACSYREFEDSLRRQLDGEDENDYINEMTIPESSEMEDGNESNKAEEEDNEQSENEEDRLYYIGETILIDGMETTLNDVQISDNINEVGLEKEEFSAFNYNLLNDDGSINDHYQLITIDVTIKNISAGGYDPDGNHDKPNIYSERLLGFKDELEASTGPHTIELAYFSDPPPYEQNQWSDYAQFQLDHGEEFEATYGWFVPIDKLNEEPLYYINGARQTTDARSRNWKYFHIISEGEVVYPN